MEPKKITKVLKNLPQNNTEAVTLLIILILT